MTAIKPFIDLPMGRSNRADMAEVTSEGATTLFNGLPATLRRPGSEATTFCQSFRFHAVRTKTIRPERMNPFPESSFFWWLGRLLRDRSDAPSTLGRCTGLGDFTFIGRRHRDLA